MTTAMAPPVPSDNAPKPMLGPTRSNLEHVLIIVFVVVPFLALLAAVPLVWGWGVSWLDLGLLVGFYFFSGLGVTVGFHRGFTHSAFKARRSMKIGLATAGSMSFQGPIITWVADHRRHHAFADKEGDPHSPWLFGTSPAAVAKGFVHSHFGWLLKRNQTTNITRFAPDLVADLDIRRINTAFPLLATISLLAPAVLGGLITMSWWGAVTGLFWGGLVRIAVLHHVTWSINSICHMIGNRPYATRDRSMNVWPLAILSMGESWHNLHHADPTSARHGVGRGQLDISARLIWIFERFGWVRDVRWPTPARLARIAGAGSRRS